MTNEELVALIQAGERDRLPELWDQVEKFVALRARKLLVALGDRASSYALEFGDLYNSGYFALLDAVDTYDPEPGVSFIGRLALRLKTTFAKTGGWYGRSGKRSKAQDPLHMALSMDTPVKAGADDGDKAAFGNFIPDPRAAQALRDVDDSICRAQTRQAVQRALNSSPWRSGWQSKPITMRAAPSGRLAGKHWSGRRYTCAVCFQIRGRQYWHDKI